MPELILKEDFLEKLGKLVEGINAASLQLLERYKKKLKDELTVDEKKLLRYLLLDLEEALKFITKSTGVKTEPGGRGSSLNDLNKFLKQLNLFYKELYETQNYKENLLSLKALYDTIKQINYICDNLSFGYWEGKD